MPLVKCRAANWVSMPSLRSSAQSIASYRSSSSQPATPSTTPRELVAVWARSPRAIASFDPGSITVAISMAHTRSRLREGVGPPVRVCTAFRKAVQRFAAEIKVCQCCG